MLVLCRPYFTLQKGVLTQGGLLTSSERNNDHLLNHFQRILHEGTLRIIR